MGGRREQRMRTWAFARATIGAFLVRNGSLGINPYGAQCVNVPNCFWQRLGLPAIEGNAGDWVGILAAGRRWIQSGAGRRPEAGDCLVFPPSPSMPFGHVDITLDGHGRGLVLGVDQNFPIGSPCSQVWHDLGLVAGWIRVT